MNIEAVFFDVDGVLVDSMEAHLQICRDKGREFGLDLNVPDGDGVRDMVRRGVKVSPMKAMFEAVGFPEPLAARADADYEREFMLRYAPQAYPGAVDLLAALKRAGMTLGMVTSNTLANLAPALGEGMDHFDPRLLFARDDAGRMSKAVKLREGVALLGVDPARVCYVGDQPDDRRAAAEVGTRFLAVTYGWGFGPGDNPGAEAGSVADIRAQLLERPQGAR
jgi:phosphoglycolate phosphatase-like HAD superfamily hydrolase